MTYRTNQKSILTVDFVHNILNNIKLLAIDQGDNETAHVVEASLYEHYVQQAAENGDPVAKEILKSKDIKYTRWFS